LEAEALEGVKEQGFVKWCVRDGHVRVQLRPSLLSAAAYARVMGWLACHRPERVLLSYFIDKRWEYEFLRKRGEAARRVRWLVELYGGGGYCNTRRRTCSLASVQHPEGWRQAMEFWRELRQDLDPSMAARAFDAFFSRWILYARELDQRFSVCDFGGNHSPHVMKWLRANRGVGIADPPDSLFSQGCARVYETAAGTFAPRADETDVICHWTGYGQRRSRFRRLVLPFRLGTRTWVLSGIDMDARIELLE